MADHNGQEEEPQAQEEEVLTLSTLLQVKPGSTIFGKTEEDFPPLLNAVIAGTPFPGGKLMFLNSASAKYALSLRKQLCQSDKDGVFTYGELGVAVSALLAQFHYGRASQPARKYRELLIQTRASIESKSKSTGDPGSIRKTLLEFFVGTARIADQLDALHDSQQHTKQFVRLFLKAVVNMEKSHAIFIKLLEQMGIAHAIDQDETDQLEIKVTASKCVVATLVDGMDTVVEAYCRLEIAKMTCLGRYPQALPEEWHAAVESQWQTDDFVGEVPSNLAGVDECVYEIMHSPSFVDFTLAGPVTASVAAVPVVAPVILTANALTLMIFAFTVNIAAVIDSHKGIGFFQLSPHVVPLVGQLIYFWWLSRRGVVVRQTAKNGNTNDSARLQPFAPWGTIVNVAPNNDNNNSGETSRFGAPGERITIMSLYFSLLQIKKWVEQPALMQGSLPKEEKQRRTQLQTHFAKHWNDVGEPSNWGKPLNADQGELKLTRWERTLCGLEYRWEHFGLIKVLGGGSFGRVFLANLVDKPTYRYALKVVCFTLSNIGNLNRELVDGSKVLHKNVARILTYFWIPHIVEDSKPIAFGIVMEQCMHNLYGEIDRFEKARIEGTSGQHSLEMLLEILDMFLQAATGVCELHKVNVHHRDLKPANIMIGQDGFLKIVDLGEAKTFDEFHGTMTKTEYIGSWYWRPPIQKELEAAEAVAVLTEWSDRRGPDGNPIDVEAEEQRIQARPTDKDGDRKHDEYSLAMVLYQLIAGEYPPDEKVVSPKEYQEVLDKFIPHGMPGKDKLMAIFLGFVHPKEAMRWSIEDTLPLIHELVNILKRAIAESDGAATEGSDAEID